MSANQRLGRPDSSGAAAMSSQSTLAAPGTRYVASVAPLRASTAKKRAVSPLSLCVKTTRSSYELTASPLDSVIAASAKRSTGADALGVAATAGPP